MKVAAKDAAAIPAAKRFAKFNNLKMGDLETENS